MCGGQESVVGSVTVKVDGAIHARYCLDEGDLWEREEEGQQRRRRGGAAGEEERRGSRGVGVSL